MKFSIGALAVAVCAANASASQQTDIWDNSCVNSPDVSRCEAALSKPGADWSAVQGQDPYGQGDLSYWTDMVTMALATYAPYFDERMNDDLLGSNNPGTDTTSYVALSEIKARIAALPACQEDGTCYRGNELGLLRLNEAFYPECAGDDDCGIALGISKENHEKVRPVLDEIFGDGTTDGRLGLTGNKWSKAELRTSADYFLKDRNTIDVKVDSGIWTTMVLHEKALGLSVTYEEGKEFVDFQAKAVVITALPSGVVSALGWALGLDDALARKARYLERYEEAIKRQIASGYITTLDAADAAGIKLAARGFLDALIFAGGLSVPGVIMAGMASYYTGLTEAHLPAGEKFDIDDPTQAPLLVFECIRNYPPVLGVPYIQTDSGYRHAPLAGMGGYDKAAYGEDAREFKIRGDFNYYHSRSIDWADSGAPVEGKPWTSHICPAKAMSYNMILAFWEALGPTNWSPDPEVPISRENGPVWWTSPVLNRECQSMGTHVGSYEASRAAAESHEGGRCHWMSWCSDDMTCKYSKWWHSTGVCRIDGNAKFLGEGCSSDDQCDNYLTKEKGGVDLECSSGKCFFADGNTCANDVGLEFINDDEYRADGASAGADAFAWLTVLGGGGGLVGAGAFFLRQPARNLKNAQDKHTKMTDDTL